MNYQLSFARVSIISEQIAEIIIDKDVTVSLEMCEELDYFLAAHFVDDFAVINNRLHDYSLTYETMLHMGSLERLKAVAIITYTEDARLFYLDIKDKRPQEGIELKVFSGLELGRMKSIDWATQLLNSKKIEN